MTVHTPLTVASPAVGSYMWMDPWYGFLGKFARHILNTNRITTCWLINNFLKLYNLSAREIFYIFFQNFLKEIFHFFKKAYFYFAKMFIYCDKWHLKKMLIISYFFQTYFSQSISVLKLKKLTICKTFHDAWMKDTYRECK